MVSPYVDRSARSRRALIISAFLDRELDFCLVPNGDLLVGTDHPRRPGCRRSTGDCVGLLAALDGRNLGFFPTVELAGHSETRPPRSHGYPCQRLDSTGGRADV